ncbi:MAG: hypothetical protein AB7F86_04475 [Bdellovibrionales bacterium]
MKRRLVLIVLPLGLCLGLAGCNDNSESDDLAKAQACLDEIVEPNYSGADACLTYVEKYSSQQANILKCSIYMTSGGLMETKIVKAYSTLKDSTITDSNRKMAFMAILSLDQPNLTSGLTKAENANTYCQATDIPGLQYLSGVILAGTGLNKTIETVAGTTLSGSSSLTDINNAVTTMLGDCGSTSPSANCDANLSTVGTAVATLSTTYCATDGADGEICDQVKDAVSAAGSNATNLGQAMVCYLNGKTYNAATGGCSS